MDDVDKLIAEKLAKYLAVRADYFEIIRRKPIQVEIINHIKRVMILVS